MTIFLTILAVVGKVLLIVLGVILVVLAIILFVPIRYETRGSVHDPSVEKLSGKEDDELSFDIERLLSNAEGEFRFSWLLNLVGGRIAFPGDQKFMIHVAFWHFDLLEVIRQKGKGRKKQPAPKKPEDQKKSSESLLQKVCRICKDIKYIFEILQKPYSEAAAAKAGDVIPGVLRHILPGRWQVRGTVGFGDPAAAGRMMGILGMLIPVTAGHVFIEPEFMQYRVDVEGYAKGRIRMISILVAALRLVLDRNIRHTIAMLRRRPSVRKRHKAKTTSKGNKMKSKSSDTGNVVSPTA